MSSDIRTVHTSKHLPGFKGYVNTQLDVTSRKHAVLMGNRGWAYLNKVELQELITNLEDLLGALE